MDSARSRQIIIAGAGIAGLTAALAFASRGFSVQIFEQAPALQELGAGLQLSPNATRILRGLGVLTALMRTAVRPPAVLLRDAVSLAELARVPLGDAAEERWGAPYLVCHRADLQNALLNAVSKESEIRLSMAAAVRDVAIHPRGVTVSVDVNRAVTDARGLLLVGADGVWSDLRGLSGGKGHSAFSGAHAWRRTIPSSNAAMQTLSPDLTVNAFMHPNFHLVAYPIRGGSALNLVAITRGQTIESAWDGNAASDALQVAMRGAALALAGLAEDPGAWTRYPIHTALRAHPWTAQGGIALIGDAAHAMTPYAAQGAAMAIEDADTLAECVAARADDLATALPGWEAARRKRINRVARRGALNRFTWHAKGPVATVRDFVLRNRSGDRLAADLDWLYGWGSAPATGPLEG